MLLAISSSLSMAQNLNLNDKQEGFSSLLNQTEFFDLKSEVSEWYSFHDALRTYIGSNTPKNIYTLLFPDTVNSISYDQGNYVLGKVRTHSAGMVFCPNSNIIEYTGQYKLKEKQPYRLDSIAIYYNYERFTSNNIPDTLIVNIFKPQKLLYYKSNDLPRGCSMKYDLANNKGSNFSSEVKIILDNTDTISYATKKKGFIYIPLSDFNITASNYGTPVAITFSFKPGFKWSLSDTLNSNFDPLPHSKINHFYFWNFTDYDKTEFNEWNNGVVIYSWTNQTRYKVETTNGNVYWRGTSYSDRYIYPMVLFKITYDPNWIGIEEDKANDISIYTDHNGQKLIVKNFTENVLSDYSIISIEGKTIQQSSFTNQGDNNLHEIDLSMLKKGIYCINIDGKIRKTFVY